MVALLAGLPSGAEIGVESWGLSSLRAGQFEQESLAHQVTSQTACMNHGALPN